MPERSVELSDSKANFDRLSTTHSLRLTVARVDPSSEDEEESMDLKQGTSLKGLLANRIKDHLRKKSQRPKFLLPPPLLLSL